MHEMTPRERLPLERPVAALSAMGRSVTALVADLELELRLAAQAVEAPVGPSHQRHRAHVGARHPAR